MGSKKKRRKEGTGNEGKPTSSLRRHKRQSPTLIEKKKNKGGGEKKGREKERKKVGWGKQSDMFGRWKRLFLSTTSLHYLSLPTAKEEGKKGVFYPKEKRKKKREKKGKDASDHFSGLPRGVSKQCLSMAGCVGERGKRIEKKRENGEDTVVPSLTAPSFIAFPRNWNGAATAGRKGGEKGKKKKRRGKGESRFFSTIPLSFCPRCTSPRKEKGEGSSKKKKEEGGGREKKFACNQRNIPVVNRRA